MTKVSIILPALSESVELRETLRSCENQERVELEVVVVGPLQVREALQDFPKSRFVAQYPNGLYRAVNAGLIEAHGSWIMFLGEGDRFARPTSVSDLLAAGSHDAEIAAGHTLIADGRGGHKLLRAARNLGLRARWKIPFGHPGGAYRKELFDTVGPFDESFQGAADFDWMCRWLNRRHRFSRHNQVVAIVRDGGFSTGNHSRVQAIREESRVIHKFMDGAPLHHMALGCTRLIINAWRIRRLVR